MKIYLRILTLAGVFLTAGAAHLTAAGRGDIEGEIKYSFNYRMVLRNHVDVRVFNATATLTGRAEDESTKLLAAETALLHPAIERVDNQIEVKPWLREFSDGWIAEHIRLRLMVKNGVNPETTQIDVREGIATLSGTVMTPAQKALTVRLAGEVVGVNRVVNALALSSAPVARRFWDGPIDDASITSQLHHILRESSEVETSGLNCSTLDGVITLTGMVRSEAEKDRVTQLAGEVRGCVAVESDLAVAPKAPPSKDAAVGLDALKS